MRSSLLISAAFLALSARVALAQPKDISGAVPAPNVPAAQEPAAQALVGQAPIDQASAATAAQSSQPANAVARPPHAIMRHPMHHATAARPVDRSSDAAETIRPGHEPGVGDSEPSSVRASNIQGNDTHTRIAPRLPAPESGHDATAQAYLMDARKALNARQTGLAQEALERAETYALDRSVTADAAATPDNNALVQRISAARTALGSGDMAGARSAVGAALAIPAR